MNDAKNDPKKNPKSTAKDNSKDSDSKNSAGIPASSGNGGPEDACRRFEWMVGPLVDGELPTGEVEAVERHLQGCQACSALAEDYRSLDRLARTMDAPPPVSPAEWARLWDGLSREPAPVLLEAPRTIYSWLVPALSLAALALLAAWITVSLWVGRDSSAPQVTKDPVQNEQPTIEKPGASPAPRPPATRG